MANTITIDLDSLSKERAEKLAGFILTYAGLDEPDNREFQDAVERTSSVSHFTAAQATQELKELCEIAAGERDPIPAIVYEPSASEVFSQQPSTISTVGPTLVIPNPPQAMDVSPAVVPPAPAADPSTNGIVVDSTGLPWDSRIHSTARTLNADGTWRARRGLADGYAAQIEKELRQVMAIPSPSTAAPAAASIPAPPPQLPPATPSPGIKPYLELMNKVSSALAGARITQPQLQKVCDAVGLPNFVSLGTRLDLVPVVAPMIDGILAGASV